jgi:hypothetical protein
MKNNTFTEGYQPARPAPQELLRSLPSGGSKVTRPMTLFWHPTGPQLRYAAGVLLIDDLNPEVKIGWRMSRLELLRLSWRCLIAAVRP